MREFRGAHRRTFVFLPTRRVAHLRRHETLTTGVVTFCGRVGGTKVGWPEAKALELCRVCAGVSGVA